MLPSQKPKFSEPIDYAPTSDAQLRRAKINRFTKWIFIAALGSVTLAWGWRFALQLQYLWWQHQCMIYTFPPGTIIFDQHTRFVPKCLEQVLPVTSGNACVFLHERRSKLGDDRLVVVTLWPGPLLSGMSAFAYEPATIRPKSILTTSQWISLQNPNFPLSARAGQIDPVDESHFTFEVIYSYGDEVYDGWLQDNGQVVIESRRK